MWSFVQAPLARGLHCLRLRGARRLGTLAGTDTIYALSSAGGKAGVAVVRVSGPNAHAAALAMTEAKLPPPQRAVIRRLRHPHTHLALDEALVLRFDRPGSFTGEDTVELQVHGGTAVVTSVLEALSECSGLRPAAPGEFTRRAFLNAKLDLSQVEGLADLINAETQAQQRQALRHLDGEAKFMYDKWRKQLLGSMAHVAALIDFGEDEGFETEDPLPGALQTVRKLCTEIAGHLDDNRCGERLRVGVQVTIVGAPNVGKSSLLNILSQRQVAIVAAVPGTTRDVLEVMLDIGGYPVLLLDTAGLREGDDICEVEREGIRRARVAAAKTDLKICMQDLTKGHCMRSGGLLPCLCASDFVETMVCLNKMDLVPNVSRSLAVLPTAQISCTTRQGFDAFLELLTAKIAVMCADTGIYGPTVTHARHRAHLKDCLTALDAATVGVFVKY